MKVNSPPRPGAPKSPAEAEELRAQRKKERASAYAKTAKRWDKIYYSDSNEARALQALVDSGCDVLVLQEFVLLSKPLPDKRAEGAEDRKIKQGNRVAGAKAFRKLEKLIRADEDLRQMIGFMLAPASPDPEVGLNRLHQLGDYAKQLSKMPVAWFPFTPREAQQLGLMHYVKAATGRAHYPELATVLSANYRENNLSPKENPSVDSLKHLARRHRDYLKILPQV